jgi:hypothetical protein
MELSKIMSEIEKRKFLARHYYENFEKHLIDNRISKASEFLWGTVTSLIYAIGLTYNKKLSEHAKMIEFSKELSEEENDDNIFKYFKDAEILHANFYNNFLDKEGLELKRESIDKLINKLEKALEKRINLVKNSFVESTPDEDILVS